VHRTGSPGALGRLPPPHHLSPAHWLPLVSRSGCQHRWWHRVSVRTASRRPRSALPASGGPPRCDAACAASSCVRLVQATRLPDDAAMMMQRNRPAGLDMADRSLAPVNTPEDWAPDSWRQRPALQQPSYRDPEALDAALATLSSMPPLVTSWEILALKRQLAEAQEGRRFLLQGGDCAESFADCEPGLISNRLKVLLQMSLVLVHGLRMPVVRVGRFAGQYAKPRS